MKELNILEQKELQQIEKDFFGNCITFDQNAHAREEVLKAFSNSNFEPSFAENEVFDIILRDYKSVELISMFAQNKNVIKNIKAKTERLEQSINKYKTNPELQDRFLTIQSKFLENLSEFNIQH
jgi:hypothetical protein